MVLRIALSFLVLVVGFATAALPGQAQAPEVSSNTVTTFLQPGFNLIGWIEDDVAAEAVGDLIVAGGDNIEALFGWDAAAQEFRQHRPGVLAILNTLDTVENGRGVFVLIGGTQPVVWTRSLGGAASSVDLSVGFNLVAWGGADGTSVIEGVATLGDALLSVSVFDPAGGFQTYDARLPQTLRRDFPLRAGQGMWVQMAAAAVWSQGAGFPPQTFEQSILTVYGLPDVETWFSFVSDAGTLYTGEGTKTPLGNFDQFERLTVETGSQRFIYHFDDRGLITRLEGWDFTTGETLSTDIRYGPDAIEFDFFEALSAPLPVGSITIRPGDDPELDELFAQLQAGSLSLALPARSAEADSAGLRTAAEGDVAQLAVRVEVRDTRGQFVPGMTVKAVAFLPQLGLTANPPVTDALASRPTADPSFKPVGRVLVSLDETAPGVHTRVINVQAPTSENTVRKHCQDAAFWIVLAATSHRVVLVGLGIVGLAGAAFTLGPLYVGAGVLATSIGVSGFFELPRRILEAFNFDPPRTPQTTDCEEVVDLAKAELGLQYAFEAEITESARAAGWRGIGKPDVGIPSTLDFSVTGEKLRAAALLGQPLPVQVEITVPFQLLDIHFDQEDPDAEFVVGELISFVATVSGGTPPYRVTFDGPTETVPLPFDNPGRVAGIFQFPTAGLTTITATVEDGEGLRISDSLNVGVDPSRPVIFVPFTGLGFLVQPFEDIFFFSSAMGGAPGPYTWTISPQPVRTDVEPRVLNEAAGVGVTLRFDEGGITVPVCLTVSDNDGVDSEEVCRNVEVALPNFATDWHSIHKCMETEGSDFEYTWQVSLTQSGADVSGTISFHACPGRGRVQYAVSGTVDPKSDTVTLNGGRSVVRGALGANSPPRVTFTIRRLGEPDPNLDPIHDLAIQVDPLVAAAFVDESIEYKVTVTNNGGDRAEAVEVRITPSGASWEFLGSSGACDFNIPGGPLGCRMNPLDPGQSATFFFLLVARSAGQLDTTIRVDAAGSDFIQPNNARTALVAVREGP